MWTEESWHTLENSRDKDIYFLEVIVREEKKDHENCFNK